MDDIKEINPSLFYCSQKEQAFIRINYPGAAEFVKNEIDFSEFLRLKARLSGPDTVNAAIEHIGKVDDLAGWKRHFTVNQIKKLKFDPV